MKMVIKVVRMSFSFFLRWLNDLLNFNRDDPLRFVRLSTIELAKIPILKILLLLGLSYNVFFFLIEIVYFALNFELKQFIQFFSLNVGALHGYVSSWTCLQYEKNALELCHYQDEYFIKLGRVKASSYERIMKSATPRRYLYLLNLLSLHLLFLFLWPLFGYEDEYYFPVYFLNEYVQPLFGRYIANSLRLGFYLSTYGYVISAGVQVHICTYFLSQLEFQLIVVEDHIRDFGKTTRIDRGINSRLIDEKLKVCIQHYFCVKKFLDTMKEWVFWPMLAATVGSLIMLLSYVYFVLAQASLEALPRVASLSATSIFTISLYAICGQGLVDQCDSINGSLYFLPWYKYSKKNCELLRLFMVATSKPLYLSLLGFIEIHSLLVMKVYKFLFSSLAAVQQIVALRKKDE